MWNCKYDSSGLPDPVPTADAEGAYQRDLTVGRIRRSLEDWKWNGPAISE